MTPTTAQQINPHLAEILQQPDVWLRYNDLAQSLSHKPRISALKAMTEFLRSLKPGSSFDSLPIRWQAMLAIAVLHVGMGTPLFFSDELALEWELGDGTAGECPRDGYRVPVSITKCPVCGSGTVPPGMFAARRGGNAAWN